MSQEKFEEVKSIIDLNRWGVKNYYASDGFIARIRYRLFRPFIKLKYKRYRSKNPESPWMNPDAIKALDLLLHPQMDGFEYGSGYSTIFFASRIKSLTSLEHHQGWFEKMGTMLKGYDLNNTQLVLVKPEKSFDVSGLSSIDQIELKRNEYPVQDDLFVEYTDYVTNLPDHSLDLLVVDGRARVTCAKNGIPKIKEGGLLVLDNAERKRYAEVHELTQHWPKLWTTTGLTDTCIWRKPARA